MKLSVIPIALLISAAASTTVTNSEADDWYECTRRALKSLNNGKDDSGTTCQFFECLISNADEYHRGGLFGEIAPVLNGVCAVRGIPVIGKFLK